MEGIRPFAVDLARRLAAVSLFDREIHIRRAASAAFQENVGRMVRVNRISRPLLNVEFLRSFVSP